MTDVLQSVQVKQRWWSWPKIAVATFAFAVLVLVGLEPELFVMTAITGVVAMVAVPALLFGLLGSRRGVVLWSGGTLAVVLGAFMVAARIANRQQVLSMERGDTIAAALARYHEREGSYPDALAELVPVDLKAVPISAMGVFHDYPFRYSRGTENYVLSFPSIVFLVAHRRADGNWRVDD